MIYISNNSLLDIVMLLILHFLSWLSLLISSNIVGIWGFFCIKYLVLWLLSLTQSFLVIKGIVLLLCFFFPVSICQLQTSALWLA